MKQLPIIERAIAHGDRIAFRGEAQSSAYSDLLEGSAQVASALLDGEQDLHEQRIAFLVPAGDRYTKTQWGIWRSGGVAVPLSLSATESELEYALVDAQAETVVVSDSLLGKVASIGNRHKLRILSADDSSVVLEPRLPGIPRLPEISPNRRAMILYTSGTTSKPKGVVTTHACIQAQIESLVKAWHWQASDRIPLFLPLHHIHGIINILSCALWSGAEIEAFSRFESDVILRRVSQEAYTVFMAVPTIYVKLIEALEELPEADRHSVVHGFGKMRLMVSGSAALPASVHEKWTELTGQKLLERYGMTEIGMALSNPYDGQRRPGAVGIPLPGVEIRLQSESGESIKEEGASGEIQVRGPNVFQEYWNRPEATRDSFVDGWFRTGDMAVVEDGYYRIMGRSSVDIIKSGGYKLSALEIEAALLDHPAVAQCAVVGVPNETWGETVAAAVVLKPNASLDLDSLRSWCKDRVSHYKVPRQLLVVDELPRNAMGKVTKPSVLKQFQSTLSETD